MLPTVLSPEEVAAVLKAAPGQGLKYRVALSRSCGAGSFVDGSIKCYRDRIGDPESMVFVGGAPEALARVEPYLRPVGGDLRRLRDNAAAPAARDLGLLSVSVTLYLGVAHGARIGAAEGVGVDVLASMVGFGPLPRNRAENIHADAFGLKSLHPGASLAVWTDVADQIRQQAHEAGISTELPDIVGAIYTRALDAGFGDEDVAAFQGACPLSSRLAGRRVRPTVASRSGPRRRTGPAPRLALRRVNDRSVRNPA